MDELFFGSGSRSPHEATPRSLVSLRRPSALGRIRAWLFVIPTEEEILHHASPTDEKLPAYDAVAHERPPGYRETLSLSLEDIAQVMIENYAVGSYMDFFLSCCGKAHVHPQQYLTDTILHHSVHSLSGFGCRVHPHVCQHACRKVWGHCICRFNPISRFLVAAAIESGRQPVPTHRFHGSVVLSTAHFRFRFGGIPASRVRTSGL